MLALTRNRVRKSIREGRATNTDSQPLRVSFSIYSSLVHMVRKRCSCLDKDNIIIG